MHDPAIHSSSFDLAPRGSRRLLLWAGAVAGVAVLAIAAFVVFKLVLAQPGAAACDHFESLAAKDPDRADIVRAIELRVESKVVRYNAVGTERVKVSGCRDALATLDKAMPHGQFTRLTDCIEKAKTAATAAACF
jgi:hypothetical protein